MTPRMTPPELAVSLVGLRKTYGALVAVEGLTLDLVPGSFTVLLGPSGCGKSTTLEMLAGLTEPDAGRVHVAGRDLTRVPAERRPVSLVFQKPLLLPHLSVAGNVGFGLRMRGVGRSERDSVVTEALAGVQLDGFGARRVSELSGGQEQRVALARALVLRPDVLLLDEPFSALDAPLRTRMRALVRDLLDRRALTSLFVTHDLDEALALADRIVLMIEGRVVADGTPEELFASPPSLAVARFLGATNELVGEVADGVFAAGAIRLPTDAAPGPGVLVVRPELVRIDPPAPPRLRVRIEQVRFAGTHLEVTSRTSDDQRLVLHAPVGSDVRPGAELQVGCAPADYRVFEDPS